MKETKGELEGPLKQNAIYICRKLKTRQEWRK
jgi:hypothetical protein